FGIGESGVDFPVERIDDIGGGGFWGGAGGPSTFPGGPPPHPPRRGGGGRPPPRGGGGRPPPDAVGPPVLRLGGHPTKKPNTTPCTCPPIRSVIAGATPR